MTISDDQVREVFERVGLACLMYYPEIHVDDDEYDLQEQAAWCIEPIIDELSDDARAAVTETVARTIVNPTDHRQHAFDSLTALHD